MAADVPPARPVHVQVLRFGKRVGIAVAGGVLILVGIAGLALPVLPGIGLIVLGLGVLSLEFERPRIWLARLKARGLDLKDRISARRSRSGDGS